MNGRYITYRSASETEWVVAFIEDGTVRYYVTFWGNDSVDEARKRAEEYADWKNKQLSKWNDGTQTTKT